MQFYTEAKFGASKTMNRIQEIQSKLYTLSFVNFL